MLEHGHMIMKFMHILPQIVASHLMWVDNSLWYLDDESDDDLLAAKSGTKTMIVTLLLDLTIAANLMIGP